MVVPKAYNKNRFNQGKIVLTIPPFDGTKFRVFCAWFCWNLSGFPVCRSIDHSAPYPNFFLGCSFKRGTRLYLSQPYPCSKCASAPCMTRVVKLYTKIVYLNSCLMWKVILKKWLYCQWGFFLKCAFHMTAVEGYCKRMRMLPLK